MSYTYASVSASVRNHLRHRSSLSSFSRVRRWSSCNGIGTQLPFYWHHLSNERKVTSTYHLRRRALSTDDGANSSNVSKTIASGAGLNNSNNNGKATKLDGIVVNHEALMTACQRSQELVALSRLDAAVDVLQAPFELGSVVWGDVPSSSVLVFHKMILTTASACVEKGDETSTRKVLGLTLFAERTGLPLTLPLYDEIASLCGKFLNVSDVMGLVESMERLGAKPNKDFFLPILFSFLEKEKPDYTAARDTAELMVKKYGYSLSFRSSIRLLRAIRSTLNEDNSEKRKLRFKRSKKLYSKTTSEKKDLEDAVDLAILASGPILSMFEGDERAIKTFNLSRILDDVLLFHDIDNCVHDFDISDIDSVLTVVDESDTHEKGWDMNSIEGNENFEEIESSAQDENEGSSINDLLPRLESALDEKKTKISSNVPMEVRPLYIRDSQSWSIPDITLQLAKLSGIEGNETLKFTKHEEEDLTYQYRNEFRKS